MMARSAVLLLILFTSFDMAYGQNAATDMTCHKNNLVSKVDVFPVYKKGMAAMKSFFGDAAEELIPSSTTGIMELNMIICYQDEAVLLTINNKTEMYVDLIQWKRHIEDMKGWKSGSQNGRNVSYPIKLILEIKNGMVSKIKYNNGVNTIE
jgi:hypothetical protein